MDRQVAYFSMEIALEVDLPTYSGGLGVLAGDTIRSAADLHVPMVAVTLLYRKGYFRQRLDAQGRQQEEAISWTVSDRLNEMPPRVSVRLEGRAVQLRAWKYDVVSSDGFTVPVYFLDADLPDNAPQDRALTDSLYGGDNRYRLCQEVILGVGGVHMLRALGYLQIERFHMNEGHAALLTLALLDEAARKAGGTQFDATDLERVRQQCVFTTHTPVPAGHDTFPIELAEQVLGRPELKTMPDLFCENNRLDMTHLALNLSRYVNGVAKKHGEVSRQMFDTYTIEFITNGVHAATWVAPAFQALLDKRIPGWRDDNFSLRYALGIPPAEIWEAHTAAKRELIDYVNRTTSSGMEPDTFTIGFARRAAAYKRADLLFHDVERLKQIVGRVGAIQVVYAGKAHPADAEGKALITRIFQAREQLKADIRIAYLENYDMTLGRLITAGVDVWLNTPQPPLEASGTSGMKAAVNGVPSLSTLDGWWIEGHIEGVTGWAIGDTSSAGSQEERVARDAEALYRQLDEVIVPLYYRDRARYIEIMRHAIALNGSFFNTQRMVQEYVLEAYFR